MRRYSNTAADTTLNGAITDTATSITLASVTGWPVPGTGESALAVIEDELVEYTGISTNTLTGCTRGVDGTVAAAHADAVAVQHAGSMEDLDRIGGGYSSILGSGGYTTIPHSSRSTQGLVLNRAYATPIWIPEERTFDRIAAEVTTASTAGDLRLGIYADDDGLPGALILDAGTVPSTSTGLLAISISQTLAPGRYWLAISAQGSDACSVRRSTGSPFVLSQAAPDGATANIGYQQLSVSGALPDPYTGTLTTTVNGLVFLRAA